jgi:hypothetical protein
MAANATVAEVAGKRRLIGLDKGHRLEIGPPGGPSVAIEARPVTEFSAAVDAGGKLHVAAWLLSRQLMYYTSVDGESFTRSTLLKSDGNLRLRDPLITAAGGVTVVYVAETEYADTLVCYRYENGDWEGKRLVEVEHPQRLAAYQFDGAPGPLSLLYGVKDTARTVVMARPLSDAAAPETVAAVAGGIADFCAMTSGGARQACWLSDGRLSVNGLRQPDEPWSRTWPHFRRGEGGVQCLWLENGMLCGTMLGAQRSRLIPVSVRNAVPCMLALPGETRKSVVDGAYKEPSLHPEFADRISAQRFSQPPPDRPEGPHGRGEGLTLTEVVRNQAIYLTRMQESLGAMERNTLKMQAEVNRLSREMAALMAERQKRDEYDRRPKPSPQFSIASVKREKSADEPQKAEDGEEIADELSERPDEAKPEEAAAAEAAGPAANQEEAGEEAERVELPGDDFPVT